MKKFGGFLALIFLMCLLGHERAHSQNIMLIPNSSGPSGGGGTTWNPLDADPAITLSGGNLIATQNGAAFTWRAVRATSSYAVGTNHKVVAGITMSAYDNNLGWIGGLADSTMNLASFVGASGNSWGWQLTVGAYHSGGVSYSNNCTGATLIVGSTLYYAVDFNTGKMWCSSDCTVWSGSPDGGTSQSGTLPASTAFFVAWSGDDYTAADAATLNAVPNLAGCTNVSTFTTWN